MHTCICGEELERAAEVRRDQQTKEARWCGLGAGRDGRGCSMEGGGGG